MSTDTPATPPPPRSRFSWLVPDGLLWRTASVLIVVFALVHLGYWLAFGRDRDRAIEEQFVRVVTERVVATVELWEQASPEDRPAVLQAVRSRNFHVRHHLRAPRDLALAESTTIRSHRALGVAVAEALARRLTERMPAGNFGDDLRVAIVDRERMKRTMERRPKRERDDALPAMRSYATARPRGRPGVHALRVMLPLPSTGWLVFTTPIHPRLTNPIAARVIAVSVTALVAVVVLIFIAHRQTLPLRRFANAAERLGLDVNAPALPLRGSRELKRATHAFNEMQSRLQRLIGERTHMLGAVSHDLKTMLTRLRLRVEYIEDAEQRDKALADIETMQSMLDESLAFARDDHHLEARTRFDLAVLAQSICDDFADHGDDVRYDGPRSLSFEGQVGALGRALTNLIENAVRYGATDGQPIEIQLRNETHQISIFVLDRGPGINDTLREQVFSPFFRIETSRSRETGGTGLGLTIARDVAQRHGGNVTLHARPGGGLCARLDLPVPFAH